jgi:uncharacterized membrane protein YkoI
MVCMYREPRCLPACALALMLALLPGCTGNEPDIQAAGTALEREPGKVLPLTEILALTRRIAPGKVIEVELESDVGLDDGGRETRWVYEIEVLTADNRIIELEIDALSGKLLEIDGAPWPADIPQEPAP